MTSHGKELIPDIVSFFIENMHDKSVNEWKKEIDISNEKELITIRQKFEDHQSSLPSKAEVKLYSTYSQFNISNKKFPITIPNGDQGIIEVSHDYCNEIIELIDQRIEELKTNKVKEFPNFGEWDNLDNPKLFKLKRGVLACLVHSFDRVTVLLGLTYEEIYNDLSNILIKSDGSNYKSKTIKNFRLNNEKKKTLKECNKKVLFNIKESIEFVSYLLDRQKF